MKLCDARSCSDAIRQLIERSAVKTRQAKKPRQRSSRQL
jgi:hypothetical protein